MRYILLALVLVAGCDITAPARRTAALERRIAELEDQLAAKDVNDIGFDRCMGEVEGAYWAYVKLNGGRTRQTPKGMIWRAATSVWNQAAADKRNAIELCKLTWKKGN